MVSMVMTQRGVTALYFASQEGHVTVVRLLLEKGADVNICNKVVMDFVSSRAYRAAKGGERACNARSPCVDGKIQHVTKNNTSSHAREC